MRPNRLPVDDSELPDLADLPELSPKLKQLADSILDEGPVSLVAFVKYFLEQAQRDPQWMNWLQQAAAELGLPDFSAAASTEDLNDGLIYKVKITLRRTTAHLPRSRSPEYDAGRFARNRANGNGMDRQPSPFLPDRKRLSGSHRCGRFRRRLVR